jgi:hypothetical protein
MTNSDVFSSDEGKLAVSDLRKSGKLAGDSLESLVPEIPSEEVGGTFASAGGVKPVETTTRLARSRRSRAIYRHLADVRIVHPPENHQPSTNSISSF